MSQSEWQLLITAPNVPSARALATSLSAQGVSARVVPESTLMGEALPCRIMVAATSMERARELIAQGPFSEQELAFLATGALSCDAAKE